MSHLSPARRPSTTEPVRSGLMCAAAAGALALFPTLATAAGPGAPFAKVVVFGDSISDGGSYAAKAPAGAGSFTTNPDPVWVEVIARSLDLDLTPNALDGGTNYAEGGARVATARPNAPGDLSRRPVTAQIDDFLGKGGVFGPDSLVIVQGGGNDVFFTQTNGLGFTPEDLRVLDGAAQALADQVTRLAAAGAETIVTVSVPKFEVFNERYEAALRVAQPNVLYVDIAALIAEIEADPAPFGITNTTNQACRGAAVQSFTCLPADYVTPDANRTYLYADGVHFTGVVHEIEAQATLAALLAPGQISQLPYLMAATAQNHRLQWGQAVSGDEISPGAWKVFGSAGGDRFELRTTPQHTGLDTDVGRLSMGASFGLTSTLSLGGVVGWARTDSAFGGDAGGFEATTLSLAGYAKGTFGAIETLVSAEYADTDFGDIRRRIALGPALREEVGETSGQLWAVQAEAAANFDHGALRVRPTVGLRYDEIRLDGYAEAGQRSTQMTFAGQDLETLMASVGVRIAWHDPDAAIRPYASLAYEVDLLDRDRLMTVTPSGAPVSFTTTAYQADLERVRYGLGAETTLGETLRVFAGVNGTMGDDAAETASVFIGASLRY